MSDDAEDKKPEDKTAEDEAAEDETVENAEESESGEEDGDEDKAPKGLLGGKLKLDGRLKYIAIAAMVLVLLGGGTGLYFAGVFGGDRPHQITVELPGDPVMYAMKPITVDLKPSERRRRPFIQLDLQAELQGENAEAAFVANEVKIMDAIHAHLRTVTAEELSGREGTERLRTDITIIINRNIEPEHAITVFYNRIMVR